MDTFNKQVKYEKKVGKGFEQIKEDIWRAREFCIWKMPNIISYLQKCKPEPQQDTITHHRTWLTASIGEDVRLREPSYVAGGNANSTDTLENSLAVS